MARVTLLVTGLAILTYLVVVLVSVPALALPVAPKLEVPGGDPARGRTLIDRYGCGSCHTVPGVPGADSWVGPPLTAFSKRSYVAGRLANTPENLTRWLQSPQEVSPGTAMPNLGVSSADARDMAAYLYTLGTFELAGWRVRACLHDIRFWAC